MPHEDVIRLRHMLEAIADARRFMEGKSRSELGQDRMLLFALIRCIEIIGEAASRITAETREAAPHVPWAAIIGMRNRLVHAYFDVDADILWKTVNTELPELAAQIASIHGQN